MSHTGLKYVVVDGGDEPSRCQTRLLIIAGTTLCVNNGGKPSRSLKEHLMERQAIAK